MQVSEARRANGAGERARSDLKHVQSATNDLAGTEHHFNFMQVSQTSTQTILYTASHAQGPRNSSVLFLPSFPAACRILCMSQQRTLVRDPKALMEVRQSCQPARLQASTRSAAARPAWATGPGAMTGRSGTASWAAPQRG